MISLVDCLGADRLCWFPQIGVGYYPVRAMPYDAAYWERYRAMDHTPAGDALTAARLNLVSEHFNGEVVDIGIGGGRFVEERPQTFGYDVNPEAVRWLKGVGRWRDPYAGPVDAASFWDSLEHIENPAPLLANIRLFAFVSAPVFTGPEHVLHSKHFRPTEHFWYYTVDGLRWLMYRHGFEMVSASRVEEECGREDIGTFVFARRKCI